ncbi:MAG: N-acetylmuramoyl-L-alanine amidase [Tyzzerella sp.]|nr:N-acetylmuramoyl-L-alanine amidase [Tyzzerella sp.]
MVLFLLIGAIVASYKLSEWTADVVKDKVAVIDREEPVIVIDPGHGGEDPGKVGVNDILEKDINLQISMKVRDLLEEVGITVVMTREDDKVPDRKKEDLGERVELINKTKPTLALCIHQNSYTTPDIFGAQVFYHTKTEEAEDIATLVQESMRAIDPNNKREIKENDTYYMLKFSEVPTIIVECGFLTNPTEAQKLTTEEYQNEVAFAICEGIVKWLDK